MIEAMALSRPVVATGIEGNTVEVTHGETGLLCRPADPADAVLDPTHSSTLTRTGRFRYHHGARAARIILP